MTIPKVPMSCERFADVLADLLERDVDESTRAGMEAHAQACGDCGPLLADLRALRVEAENLPELAPSRDLWKGIAARIETPVVALKSAGRVTEPVTEVRRWRGAWMGIAAAGLVAITATVTYELTARSMVSGTPAPVASVPTAVTHAVTPEGGNTKPQQVATAPDSVAVPQQSSNAPVSGSSSAELASLASNRSSIERTYDNEIARLRVVVNKRRSQLDSATVVVLEHNLKVIDDAIAQCKQALSKDPGSRFLMESLNDALDTKVQLLRTAATLPSKA